MRELTVFCANLADTTELGRKMAELFGMGQNPSALYLCGPLGCGKTTLIRALCIALPGGEQAEIASPSFTICNEYPTRPVVCHVDLYRLGANAQLPEEAENRPPGSLLALEWPENLAAGLAETPRLDIRFLADQTLGQALAMLDIPARSCETCRSIQFIAQGRPAEDFLDALAANLAAPDVSATCRVVASKD